MKTTIKTILVVFLILGFGVFSSCGGDDSPTNDATFIKAKLNGNLYESNECSATLTPSSVVLNISGANPASDAEPGLSLAIYNYNGPGTYSGESIATILYLNAIGTIYYGGEAIITVDSDSGGKISGTFSGTIYSQLPEATPESYTVTNGSFKGDYVQL